MICHCSNLQKCKKNVLICPQFFELLEIILRHLWIDAPLPLVWVDIVVLRYQAIRSNLESKPANAGRWNS